MRVRNFNKASGYLKRGTIANIKTDSDNIIWIVRFNGITKYDGHKFQDARTVKAKRGLFIDFKENKKKDKYFVDNSGRMFPLKEGYILENYRWNDTIIDLLGNNRLTDYYYDESENYHVSSYTKGYFKFDSIGNISSPLKEKGIEIDGFACILFDDKTPFLVDNMYYNEGKKNNYFYLFDSTLTLIEKIPISRKRDGLTSGVEQLSNGKFLVTTGKGHLIEFDKTGNLKVIPYPHKVFNILEDSQKGLWLSTEDGIYFYRDLNIEDKNKVKLFDGAIGAATCVDFHNGVWAFTEKDGLNRIAFPLNTFYPKEKWFKNQLFSKMTVKDQKVYLTGSQNSCTIIDLKQNSLDSLSLPITQNLVIDIQIDNNNRLWVSERGKLYYKERDKWHQVDNSHFFEKERKSKFYLDGKTTVDSLTLVGFYENQFFCISDTNVAFVSKKFSSPILSVLVEEDTAWVTTHKGLFLYINDSIVDLSKKGARFSQIYYSSASFNNRQWFESNDTTFYFENGRLKPLLKEGHSLHICYLIPEGKDRLWAISKIAGGSFLISSQKEDSSFQISPYAAVSYFRHIDFDVDDSSIYWLIQDEGVLVTKYKHLKSYEYLFPSLHLKELKINNEKADINFGDQLVLSFDENYIELSFVGVSYSNRSVNYRFRLLDGKEKNEKWKVTKDGKLQLLGLSPGEYQIELQSRLWGLKWGESKFITFKITPPFWQTWWFITCVIVLISFIVYKVAVYRINILNKEKNLIIGKLVAEQKALRAKMDPHFISNIMSAIQFFILKQENEKASKFVQMFSNLMRNTLDQSDGEMISIEEEIEFLTEYIEMEKFRFEDRFDFVIQVDDSVKLDGEIPNFLIQPLVENAIKHGLKNSEKEGLLEIILTQEKDELCVIVQDNGVGIARTKKVKKDTGRISHGVKTIEERLSHYEGKPKSEVLKMIDRSEEDKELSGTKVQMKIKIK